MSANVLVHNRRKVVSYQRRNLSDVLFQSVVHYLFEISGDFWFVLICESDTANPLTADRLIGKVHIFKSKADWACVRTNVSQRLRSLNELRLSIDPGRFALMNGLYKHIHADVSRQADISIDFILHRSGEVEIDHPRYKDEELRESTEAYARQTGHEFDRWVCDQAYFFLRDICHTHQHHDSKVDTILILQARDAADIQWRNNILYSLHHYVIKTRRFSMSADLYRAMGILAYARSFSEICARERPDVSLTPFNIEALLESMRARASEAESLAQVEAAAANSRLAKSIGYRTYLLAAGSIAVTLLVLLIQPRINSSERDTFPFVNHLSDFASEHLKPLAALLGIVLLVGFVFTRPGRPGRGRFSRDLYSLALPAHRTIGWVSIIAGFVIAAAAGWILREETLSILDSVRALI